MLLKVRDVSGLMADSPISAESSSRCLRIEVRSETEAGENYGSTFLMANAFFEDPEDGGNKVTVPVVCKLLPPTEYLRKTFNVDVSFPKEVNFYRVVAPAITALQCELRIPDGELIQAFPRLYGARIGGGEDPSIVDDNAILVLEDLVTSGFKCGERNVGLDLEHCRVAIRELARLHGAGIALRLLRPAVFNGTAVQEACAFFMHNRLEENDAAIKIFVENSLKLVLDEVPEVKDVLDEATLRCAAGSPRDFASKDRPFACIVHNDFWVNNMMFAYDAHGRPDRLKMVDFQLTEVGSPAADLLFFIYTSADSAALAHTEELIREYHAELLRYARLHGLDDEDLEKLSWEAFQREIAVAAQWEFVHLLFMVCIIRAQKKVEKADTNSDDVFSKELGISDSAKRRYLEIVKDFVERGWIG